jgi:thiosulfate/3-mercaptopyruvate sulfurtransferase
LVSPKWLADHLGDPDVRVVEVTPAGAGYVLGHIPGAIFFDLDEALPGLDVPVEKVTRLLSTHGLSPDKRIVIYDEIGGQRAAQAFWLLEYLGFPRVSVLEGGIERWMAEGHRQTRLQPQVEPTPFEPSLRQDRIASADWVASHLQDESVVLVDSRRQEEFAEGHIPGARNRPFENTLVLGAHLQFRPADDLNREFADLGASTEREVVTYCGSGRRSSHTYLTLRWLGYPRVRNYKGSWDEWQTRLDLPQER